MTLEIHAALSTDGIRFGRLHDVPIGEIVDHMSDIRIARHMPLMTLAWDVAATLKFVAAKELCWRRDGLGHWAIHYNERYIGWGGFQKEGDEWDFGLVLRPEFFGLGARITRLALEIARADERIQSVTFLLPLSRGLGGALSRFGAEFEGEIDFDGVQFRQFRLHTSPAHGSTAKLDRSYC